MAEEKKMKRCPVTLQPDIENILDWSSLEAGDFEQASQSEKEDFIQDLAEQYKDILPYKVYEAMINWKIEIDD